jgi:hypothetical protein
MKDLLGGKSWAELEVSRHELGQLMFGDVLRKRGPDGAVVETKVKVCVPQPHDQLLARAAARAWFAKFPAFDPDRDRDVFDQMEQLCVLARAVRTDAPPHGQLCDAEELARYDEASLHDALERINVYKAMLDPREPALDEAGIMQKVVAIARSETLLPLADIAGREQPNFVVRMAKLACDSPTIRSWLASLESSTPAP